MKQTLKALLNLTPFGVTHIGGYIRSLYFWRSMRKLSIREVANVLDAGCGGGKYAKEIARRFPRMKVVAMDKNLQCLEEEHTSNISFMQRDLLDLDDIDKYDFIYCIDVLEHIPDNLKVLKNFYRALKKNGYLYAHIPYDVNKKRIFPERFFVKFNEWKNKEHIGKQYSLYELMSILEKMGFEIVEAKHTFGSLGQLAWELDRMTDDKIILKIMSMPLLKFFAQIAVRCNHKSGSTLVMGKKT